MKLRIQTVVSLIPILTLLVACGGGGGGGGSGGAAPSTTSTPNSTSPSYETISSTSTSTSTVKGTAVRSNGTSGALDLTKTSGSLTHNTGAISLNDGNYLFTDNDGFSGGSMTDGNASLTSDGKQGFSGTYDYVRPYSQTYSSGGVSYTSQGVYGVVTSSNDIPTGGSAQYTGEATGVLVTGAAGYDLNNGRATVTVDFNAGQVDVVLDNFSASDQSTGLAATAPVDSITISGMTISGNEFNGGTVITNANGSTVDITGTNTTSDANGYFYGYDSSTSAPDEVAGSYLTQGDSGRLLGTFIGD